MQCCLAFCFVRTYIVYDVSMHGAEHLVFTECNCECEVSCKQLACATRRYQYLALVAAVHGGHWDWRGSPKYNPDQLPLTREGLFNSWTQFYDVTTNIFEGSMECDCYRRKGDFNHVIENIIENRVYRGRESTIEYIQHFSDTGKNSIRFRPGVLVQKESDADLTMRLTTFLGHVLPMRQQVPDAVIVNFGLHQCSDQWSEEDLAALANSSSRAGSLMIWKTTTFRSGYPPVSPSCDVPALQAFERCGSKWHIFNAYNITTELWSSRHTQKNSIMFDANHYELIAYCILNLHLLLQLADLW